MPFDLNRCVNYISSNTTKKISEAFSRWVEEDGLTRIQWIAMYFIQSREGLSQRDLASLMNINDSSAMRLIDRLEREGWIRRERSPEDRRILNVYMTDRGSELMEKALPLGIEFNRLLVKDIEPEKVRIFLEVQQKMYENVLGDERSQK